jgi:hypothetical protein
MAFFDTFNIWLCIEYDNRYEDYIRLQSYLPHGRCPAGHHSRILHTKMGEARWQSGIADGSISIEMKINQTLLRLAIEHAGYETKRPRLTRP